MEKKILLVSNACMDKYDNTLSTFKNTLPKDHLPTHKKWKIGVESIVIHCQFLNEGVSKNIKYPALIMFSRGYLLSQMGFDCLAFEDSLVSRKNLNMSIFHPSQCYFIDENETYTSKQLNEHFNQHTLMYRDIERNFNISSNNTYPAEFIGFPTIQYICIFLQNCDITDCFR